MTQFGLDDIKEELAYYRAVHALEQIEREVMIRRIVAVKTQLNKLKVEMVEQQRTMRDLREENRRLRTALQTGWKPSDDAFRWRYTSAS